MKRLINKIKNNKALNIIFMIFKAITSLVIILIFSIIFVQRISDNSVTIGGYSIYTVVTESMVPKYKLLDIVLAKDVDTDDISVGDDVVYEGRVDDFKDKIVTHQVVDIEGIGENKKFHTKGLANNYEDPVVSSDQILAKVVMKCTILSFLSKIVNNIYGFYFIVFIPFAILLFLEILDVVHEKEKKKKKR